MAGIVNPSSEYLSRMISSPAYQRALRQQLAQSLAKDLVAALDIADDCDEIVRDGGHVPDDQRLALAYEIGVLRAELKEVDKEEFYDYLCDPTDRGASVRRYFKVLRLQRCERIDPSRG